MSKKISWKIPPCPDPGNMVLVKSKKGYRWRRKRGSVNPAGVNASFEQNNVLSKKAGPAGKRIVSGLRSHLSCMRTGYLQLHIRNGLVAALKQSGEIHFDMLNGLEMQEEYPLDRLLEVTPIVKVKERTLSIEIPVTERLNVQKLNTLVTDYYFTAVLLHGYAGRERSLRIEEEASGIYGFKQAAVKKWSCEFDLPREGRPWMVLLGVNCLEDDRQAVHPKHHRMKVLAAGR